MAPLGSLSMQSMLTAGWSGQVRFDRGIIQKPELLTDQELPSNVTLFGQSVDLTNVKVELHLS